MTYSEDRPCRCPGVSTGVGVSTRLMASLPDVKNMIYDWKCPNRGNQQRMQYDTLELEKQEMPP